MNDRAPQIYVIAGPNGSGKTTSAKTLLPELLNCHEYVNADSVAAALSPFNPDAVAMQAGRLMLERIHYLAGQGVDFAFETTLSSKVFIKFLNECKNKGYKVDILFLWLSSPELAIQRVRTRVEEGGHDIPEDVIRRRYYGSICNFFTAYQKIATNWFLYDNREKESQLIASKIENANVNITDELLWKVINEGLKNETNER